MGTADEMRRFIVAFKEIMAAPPRRRRPAANNSFRSALTVPTVQPFPLARPPATSRTTPVIQAD